MAGMRRALSLAAGLALSVLLALVVPAQQHVASIHLSHVALTVGVADDVDTDADTDTREHRVDVGVLVSASTVSDPATAGHYVSVCRVAIPRVVPVTGLIPRA